VTASRVRFRAGWAALLLAVGLATAGAGVADLNETGKAAYARGDYATAEYLFSQALREAPRDPLLHYHRAVALTKLGRWSEAAAGYQTVLRLRPTGPVAAAAREGLQALAPMTREPSRPVSETTEVPLRAHRSIGGWWTVDVVVNDTRPARFLVDTGASVCTLSRELARALAIRVTTDTPWVELQGLGRARGPVVKVASLRVGDVEAEDVTAVILDLPGVEGVLGNTFLARYTVTVDPGRRVLSLRPRP
jgi:clan AA aspartic protease (TIGR02281 family)